LLESSAPGARLPASCRSCDFRSETSLFLIKLNIRSVLDVKISHHNQKIINLTENNSVINKDSLNTISYVFSNQYQNFTSIIYTLKVCIKCQHGLLTGNFNFERKTTQKAPPRQRYVSCLQLIANSSFKVKNKNLKKEHKKLMHQLNVVNLAPLAIP
ncbi:hypothetical protein V8G54_007533, partial [Vigna mungo]